MLRMSMKTRLRPRYKYIGHFRNIYESSQSTRYINLPSTPSTSPALLHSSAERNIIYLPLTSWIHGKVDKFSCLDPPVGSSFLLSARSMIDTSRYGDAGIDVTSITRGCFSCCRVAFIACATRRKTRYGAGPRRKFRTGRNQLDPLRSPEIKVTAHSLFLYYSGLITSRYRSVSIEGKKKNKKGSQ